MNFLTITAPVQGDTLRVGEPFRFQAEIQTTGDVREVFAALVGTDLFGEPLFRHDLAARTGTYSVDEMITIDAFPDGCHGGRRAVHHRWRRDRKCDCVRRCQRLQRRKGRQRDAVCR